MTFPLRILSIVTGLLILTAAGSSSGDLEFPDLAGPYLGLKPPGLMPEIFAPGVVSTEAWEAAPTFSPDGNELFFTMRADIDAGASENRLLYMRAENGKWTRPQQAPFAMDVGEFEAFISPDGEKLFFESQRQKPPGTDSKGEIWYSEKSDSGWSEPHYLSTVINANCVMFVTAAENGTLYFNSSIDGQYGIYRSQRKGDEYSAPEFLPDEINGLYGASHPYIAPDESYILFDAQVSTPGKSALYVSFKLTDGNWSKAVMLDESVNATRTENIPYVSPDGRHLFFHRKNDIWWVSSEVIEKKRPR